MKAKFTVPRAPISPNQQRKRQQKQADWQRRTFRRRGRLPFTLGDGSAGENMAPYLYSMASAIDAQRPCWGIQLRRLGHQLEEKLNAADYVSAYSPDKPSSTTDVAEITLTDSALSDTASEEPVSQEPEF